MIFKSKQTQCYDAEFYVIAYRKMVKRFLIMSFVTLILLLLCIFYTLKRPDIQYFTSTSDGQIIPIMPITSTKE